MARKSLRQLLIDRHNHLEIHKLIGMLIICVILVIILVVTLQKRVAKSPMDLKEDKNVVTRTIDMNTSALIEDVDYNHLTAEELDYFKEMYEDTAAFTDRGIEVYAEKAFTGKLRKIITSEWPTGTISEFIPKPSFGKIEKIEYSSSFIDIFLKETKSGNVSEYVKELKKQGWKEDNKEDGDVFLQRTMHNKENDTIRIRYYKLEKRIEINATKQGG